MMRSKARFVCSLIVECDALAMVRSSLKYGSTALFIDAESFPRIAFKGNKQVVWRRVN